MLFNDHVKNILFDIWQRHCVLDFDEIKSKTHEAGELAVEIVSQLNQDTFEKSEILDRLDGKVNYIERSVNLFQLSGEDLKTHALSMRDAFEKACIDYVSKSAAALRQIECILNAYTLDIQQCRKESCNCSSYENYHYL